MKKIILVVLVLFSQIGFTQIVYVDIVPDEFVKAVAPVENVRYYINMDDTGYDEFFFNHVRSGNGTPFNPNHCDFHMDGLDDAEVLLQNTYQVIRNEFGQEIGPNQVTWSNPNYEIQYGGQTYIAKVATKLNYQFAGEEGYIGIRFLKNGEWHYGWILVSVPLDQTSITVKEFAYNSLANEAINAGQTESTNVSIDEINMRFKYYPNPTNNYLTVEMEGDGKTLFFSIDGSLINTFDLTEGLHYLDLSNYNTGLYFIQMQSEYSTTELKKVVVSK